MTDTTQSTGVLIWWIALSAVAIANIIAWTITARTALRRARESQDPVDRWRRWQVWLSAAFVFGCAFRSFVPRADVQRICLVDSWISTVAVGRSVATIAELAFMAQASLYLYELARGTKSSLALVLARLVVPCIAVAEVCSWYSCFTTNYIGNACEESIWTLSSTMLLVGFVAVWPRSRPRLRRYLAVAFVLVGGYVIFMTTVDVPMYIARWRADELAGRAYFSLADGWYDLTHRWVVTWSWSEWRTEMPWMTLYFSFAVWASISMIRAPRAKADSPLAT